MFIDRERELGALDRLYRSDRAELYILYGRRRVGKTELLRAFCANKPNLFFVATLGADADQLAAFSQAIWHVSRGAVPADFTFPSWEAAFEELATLPGRSVVVIDEFTYLIGANPALPSVLQKVWDTTLRHSSIYLVLCGSYVGLMEREVLAYQAPLYGRRTGGFLLQPLELPAAAQFFPTYAVDQQVEAWAVLGGMPYYLQSFSDSRPIFDNIHDVILSTTGRLYNEPPLLLLEELREPRSYFAVLRAIAEGHAKLNEIAQAAKIGDARATARYLDLLQQMRLVRRRVPATESRPEKSRRGLYAIEDAFLRFWFRFVHAHRGALELGLAEAVLNQRIRPVFDQHVGVAFEEAARGHIARLARAGDLPFLPDRIGGWWSADAEVDVVAINDADGSMLLGECKWSANPVGPAVLTDLQRKARLVDPAGRWPKRWYALFARTGFTVELRATAETGAADAGAEAVMLVTPAAMV